ncbi:MAG: VTT domain-containing protein [Thermodesulfobacteriota bacterium]
MGKETTSERERILKVGRNCWRKERAERLAFIVDAADYFKAFRSAASRARKSLYIAAWDIDSRTVLDPEEDGECLGDFLNRLAAGKPGLDIHILSWDFSMIYLFERDVLPLFNLGWRAHRRIRFRMDAEHPVGASQHQKIVVVDNALAFCGGIDITKNRWDTPEHRVHDPRRVNPNQQPYRPFHDVQAAVAGPAAAALGDLFRDRWQRATGRPVRLKTKDRLPAPWPEDLSPDLTDVDVAIARTLPAYKGNPEVLEVKALYEDAIASARRTIYMENQYLTSRAVAYALTESLQREHGPEVVLVLPGKSDGWLEQSTMDNLRRQILDRLRQADQNGRLRVYRPVLDREGTSPVVHSKVTVIDDRLIRVGSSNLSNRSLGLDSECDLAVEEGEDRRVEEAAAGLRNRLLAEHLGTDSRKVREVWRETGSLIETIEAFRGKERSLEPLGIEGGFWENQGLRDIPFVDPEYPAALDELMDRFLVDEDEGASRRPISVFLFVLGAFLVLAALWGLTPLRDWLTREQLLAWGAALKGTFGIPLGILAAYVVGGMVVLPVTLLHALTGVLFPFPEGFLYALSGSVLSAVVTYGLGLFLGKDAVRRLTGKRLNRLSRRLARKGWLTVLVARNLPLVPYSVMNIILGASRIRFRDYVVGTALGMIPSILVITVFSDRLFRLIEEPNWGNLAWVGLVIFLLGGAAWWLKWRLTRSG